jgi:hypothetical protein
LASHLTEDNTAINLVEGCCIYPFSQDIQSNRGNLGVFMTSSGTPFLLANSSNQYFCYSCNRIKVPCTHLNLFQLSENILETGNSECRESLTPEDLTTEDNRFNLVSYSKYPFHLKEDPSLCSVIKERVELGLKRWVAVTFSNSILIENNTDFNYQIWPKPCYLVTTNNIIKVDLGQRNFDGRKYGLINFSNIYLFTVELLMELLQAKVNSGLATTAFWRSKVETMEMFMEIEHALIKKFLNMKGRLNAAMTGFLKLTDIPMNLFKCCENPSAICIDGIVMSVENKRIADAAFIKPWIHNNTSKARFSTRKWRSVLSLDQNKKKLARKFVHEGLTIQEMDILQEDLQPSCCFQLLAHLRKGSVSSIFCPEELKEFIKYWYKDIAPAIAIAPTFSWNIMHDILQSKEFDAQQIRILANKAPLLAKLLIFTMKNSSNVEFNKCIFDIVEFIISKAKQTFRPETKKYEPNMETVSPFDFIYKKFESPLDEVLYCIFIVGFTDWSLFPIHAVYSPYYANTDIKKGKGSRIILHQELQSSS